MNSYPSDRRAAKVEAPFYQPPVITTYTAGELLDLIGPVQAGTTDQMNDNILDVGYYAPETEENQRFT